MLCHHLHIIIWRRFDQLPGIRHPDLRSDEKNIAANEKVQEKLISYIDISFDPASKFLYHVSISILHLKGKAQCICICVTDRFDE